MTTSLWSLGCLFVLKAAAAELELIEALAPAGYSPPLHRHEHVTESFYVLSGRVRVVVGDDDVVHGPGGFAHVPRGVPHSFQVLNHDPARMLLIVAPAGQWDFFAAAGQPAPAQILPDATEIPEHFPELAARYGTALLGPPLT
jgi:quercetin dioxygenase-like cupin family protein